MSYLGPIENAQLCMDLMLSLDSQDYEHAKAILAELRTRVSEAEYPETDWGQQ